MKRLLSLIALCAIATSVQAQYGFRIKNDSSHDIWVALIRGEVSTGDVEVPRLQKGVDGTHFQVLEPGQSKHQPINLSESTYVAVYKDWKPALYQLSIVPSNGKRTLTITPTKLYKFKKGMPIDVVWTGKKLQHKSLARRVKERLGKSTIQEVTGF